MSEEIAGAADIGPGEETYDSRWPDHMDINEAGSVATVCLQ